MDLISLEGDGGDADEYVVGEGAEGEAAVESACIAVLSFNTPDITSVRHVSNASNRLVYR